MSNILLETIPDTQGSTLEENHDEIFMENDKKWHSIIGLFLEISSAFMFPITLDHS